MVDVDNINDEDLDQYNLSWVQINHSTLIIGYGELDGVKYWLVQNSYGPSWGDEGTFKIRRGANDFGIETEALASNPILID